ncbi:MAG: TonB-dependent receptor, partial [Acidobacteriota bacterium]|nr:TonB-dependent receptor [Acidobacteriota bacterium]
TPQIQNQNEYTGRIDQTLGSKNFLWFRYSIITLDQTLPGGLPGIVNKKTNPGQNWGLSYVRTFSPSLILQTQFGRAHQETNGLQRWQNAPANLLSSLGISPNFVGGFIDGSSFIPSLSVSNFFGAGESNSLNPNETNIYQYKSDLTKILGRHTFKLGGEWNSSNFESFYENDSITFNTPQTSNPANPSQVGSALASFLLGVPDAASRRNVHETTRPGGVMSFYFQDSWKATPKLTVNLGIRYDRTFLPPYGKTDTIGKQGGIETGDMNFNDGTYVLQKLPPSCANRGFAPCIPTPDGSLPAHVVVDPRGQIYHDTTTNWGPHLGLAYRVTDSTVLRGSFAIFYDNWAAVLQSAQNFEGSWPDVGQQIANNLNNPIPAQPTPNTTFQNPFPSGLFPAATPFNQVQWFADPYAKNPYSMQWNIGVQHQFNQSTALTVNYVGSGSRRTDVGGYYNTALTPGPGNPQDRALFPYIHATNYDRSVGLGSYEGLQVFLNRRFSAGLAFQFAYTYSKSIDTGASDWYGLGTAIQDPYHYRNDRGPSLYDLPHVFSANIVYELPVGTGKRFTTGNKAVDYVVGNWQVNTITTARSGQDFNVNVNGDIANTGNNSGYERANLVGNPYLSNPTRQAYLNRAAFEIPSIYTFGSLGRDRLRGENFWNIDASLFRQFPFMESRRVEFRAEAFNLVNNTILANPSSNLSNGNWGQVTGTANGSRTLQLGLKIVF